MEADFWIQYNELGGIQDSEVPGGSGNPTYTSKLRVLDLDFPQYIHDNTDDEITHHNFLNAYLESKGAEPVNLDQFRVLAGSTATGSSEKAATHESHAINLGHKLVDPISQQFPQPGFRPDFQVSPSRP